MPRGRPKKVKPEVKIVNELTQDQIHSIKRANEAMIALLSSFHSCTHPNYKDIVELDDAWIELHSTFDKEIHND